jgi:hypothetical protein
MCTHQGSYLTISGIPNVLLRIFMGIYVKFTVFHKVLQDSLREVTTVNGIMGQCSCPKRYQQ